MAAFKQHVMFSSALGVGYAAALGNLGVSWEHAVLAGSLCGISGMLPDLDSGTGRPAQELFSLTAAIIPFLLLRRMRQAGISYEELILLMGATYFGIRFGAAWIFRHLTVHRGMFHSLPAALIASEIVYLAHLGPQPHGQLILAGGVFVGFLSHLILDEIYSVDLSGFHPRLNRAAGSALKLFSSNISASMLTWVLLGGLSYFIGIQQGYFQPIKLTMLYPSTQPRMGPARRLAQ